MKKLILLAILSAMPMLVSAKKQPIEGSNLFWEIKDATLTISGKGAMPDFGINFPVPWKEFRNTIAKIVIKKGISNIGNEAFTGYYNLSEVVMPNSVTRIGISAFAGCRSLTNIIIPDSVTDIQNWAFSGCLNLNRVIIPNSVIWIRAHSFYECRELKNIIIPNSVTSIGELAFAVCHGLTSITIPNSVTYIGDGAFSLCDNLSEIFIASSVTHIGERTLSSCRRLQNIYMYAEIPPPLEDNICYHYDDDIIILHVPSGSKEAYEKADIWSNFKNIVEEESLVLAKKNRLKKTICLGKLKTIRLLFPAKAPCRTLEPISPFLGKNLKIELLK